MTSASADLSFTVADGFAELAIDRPQKRNALSLGLRRDIADALDGAAVDPAIHAVVVASTSADFMVGSDLRDLARWSAHDHVELDTARIWRSLAAFPKPLLAAVRGRAWGAGCELALACDVILIDATASFAQPEIRVGLVPGAGGVQRLLRRVGPAQGMRMVLTGDPIDARTADRLGLAILAGDPLAEGRTLARGIARMPPLAVRRAKELARLVDNASLDAGLALERDAFLTLADTDDKREGICAFFDKRPAAFRGR